MLEHGGKDLESFILLNFDEARSLLVQVICILEFGYVKSSHEAGIFYVTDSPLHTLGYSCAGCG